MAVQYQARERQFWLACGLAVVASVGTWLTAVRFQDARTARREARTSEIILASCQQLTPALHQLARHSERVIQTGSPADLLAYRSAQQVWRDRTNALWTGVRLDPEALATFGEMVLLVQRWQDRAVEARLSGAPTSTLAPALLQTAEQKLQQLIAVEKTLYANRLQHRTAPGVDFLAFGLGTLALLAAAGFLLWRDFGRAHFDPLQQLTLSASDLLDGEGLVAPPSTGGMELEHLSRNVHQLGLRYLGLRSEQHQLRNLLQSLAELGGQRQQRAASTFTSLLVEQVARQMEARSAAVVVLDGPMLRMVAGFGEGREDLRLSLHDLFAELQEQRDVLVWSEANEFPDHLRVDLIDQRCHAAMAAPLWHQGDINGMLIVWHGAGRAWPQAQVAYLRAAAGMVELGDGSNVPAATPVLGTLGERIASARDAKAQQRALDDALADAVATYPGTVAELLLIQPDGRTLTVAAAKGLPSTEWDGSRCLIGEGLAGQAELQGQWKDIPDTSAAMHLLVNPFLRQWGPRSVALAPLPRLGSQRGVLAVYSRQAGAFAEAGPHLMALASQIALGLQGAQGEAVAVEASHAWSAAVETGTAIRRSQNTAEAAASWVRGAREAFSATHCGVYLLTPQGHVQRVAGHGTGPERFDPDGCRAWQQEEACASATAGCPDCRSHGGQPGHVCVPLLWGQAPIGMVTIQGPAAAYWTANRLQLLVVMTELLAFGLAGFRSTGQRSPTDPSTGA
jgi:hypothetical protein